MRMLVSSINYIVFLQLWSLGWVLPYLFSPSLSPFLPLSLSVLFPRPSMLKATHTFVWMAAQNQMSVQSSWNCSLPRTLPTSSFCSQQEQVVWALIFRLPTLSSYLTRTGTHTRCFVHGSWGGERRELSSVSNLLSYVHLSSIEMR